MEQTYLIDMSNAFQKQDFLMKLGQIREGLFRFKIKDVKALRSNPQNAWYWSCIVSALRIALAEQGEIVTDEGAHEIFKAMFLKIETRMVNTETGEIKKMNRLKSSGELTTTEFADYCERCRQFLAEWFSVVVPDPIPQGKKRK